MSQKEIILKLLEENPLTWFMSYELIKTNTKYGWLGTSADRVARDLREKELVESKDVGQYVAYKLKLKKTLF